MRHFWLFTLFLTFAARAADPAIEAQRVLTELVPELPGLRLVGRDELANGQNANPIKGDPFLRVDVDGDSKKDWVIAAVEPVLNVTPAPGGSSRRSHYLIARASGRSFQRAFYRADAEVSLPYVRWDGKRRLLTLGAADAGAFERGTVRWHAKKRDFVFTPAVTK